MQRTEGQVAVVPDGNGGDECAAGGATGDEAAGKPPHLKQAPAVPLNLDLRSDLARCV